MSVKLQIKMTLKLSIKMQIKIPIAQSRRTCTAHLSSVQRNPPTVHLGGFLCICKAEMNDAMTFTSAWVSTKRLG